MERAYNAVFRKANGWYVGYVEELPGANTQGKTLEETRENLREAIELILKANRDLLKKRLRGKKIVREKITIEVT